jgi:hypothetical protein
VIDDAKNDCEVRRAYETELFETAGKPVEAGTVVGVSCPSRLTIQHIDKNKKQSKVYDSNILTHKNNGKLKSLFKGA